MSYAAYGWIQIHADTYGYKDPGPEELEVLRLAIQPTMFLPVRVLLDASPVATTLVVHGESNHPGQRRERLGALLAEIGRRFPGSYGAIHELDDESDMANAYVVRVMVRGVTTYHADPFFSPLNPVVED
jgi:hypothetical protein